MLIDVYDFDGTIYDGDSTFDFVCFCALRHPEMIREFPRVCTAGISMLLRHISLTQFKGILFKTMAAYMDLEAEAELFWQQEKTRGKLGAWFDRTPRDLPIVIASASPEFELQYAAKLLGVQTLIGTQCDARTGEMTGINCKGAQKIERIRERIGDFTVRAMYTDDAKADGPLLAIAKERYIVNHGRVRCEE